MKQSCHSIGLLIFGLFLCLFSNAQNTLLPNTEKESLNQEKPLFITDGEKVIYLVSQDANMQKGTVSDVLQNVPGVKVDTEGNVTMRGVSEVEIWINDHPSHFNQESLKNYLQQYPAKAIDKVEVISNPSGRYTSQSDTGIINIISNDQGQENQYLSIGLQANTIPTFSPRISYVWNNDKISINAFVKGTFSRSSNTTNSYSCSFIDNALGTLDTANYTSHYQKETEDEFAGNIYLKLDYRINRQNDFSIYLNANPQRGKSKTTDSIYRHEYIDDVGEYDYIVSTNENMKYVSFLAGTYFQHRFSKQGHDLSLSLNASLDDGDVSRTEIRNFLVQNWKNRDILSEDIFRDLGWDAKVDYNIPYSENGSLYIGLTQVIDPDNNVKYYDTLAYDHYNRDTLRCEDRDFSKHQTTGLLILQHKFGNLMVKPGISLEYTRLIAEYNDAPEYSTKKGFFNICPSLHLSYRTASMHNFGLSYTRRSDFPYVRYITNRIIYEEDSYSIGNPNLKPTLTNSFEGSWTKYWENFGSIGLMAYYRNAKNTINYVTDAEYNALWGRVVEFQQPVNLGKYYDTGCELNFTYRPSPMFNVGFYANLYDSFIETHYDKLGEDVVRSELLAYSFRINFWTKLLDKIEVHASAYYSSPTQTLFALKKTAYGIDCGLSANFFQNRLSVLLNANDIFNWNQEDNSSSNPYYISYSSTKENSRYISLEMVFRFGKLALENKKIA